MIIQVIWAGKTKEHFAKEAIEKYRKQLSSFCDLEIVEIKEERGKDRSRSLEEEGKRIMQSSKDFVLLHDEGSEMTSVGFADFLKKKRKWTFVVGSAYGVSDTVRKAAGDVLALSRMTFPHDLARVILLEQIYRGLTIINRRGYHH